MSRALIQPLLRRGIPFLPKTLIPIYSSATFLSPQSQFRRSSSVSHLRKSASEGNLLRILRNEIQFELESSHLPQPPAELNGFKVDERAGQQWVSLEKQFGDNEEIKVEVTMFEGSVPVNKIGEKNSELLEDVQRHITLIVSIFKEDPNKVLVFICSAWPDYIDIHKVYLRERATMPRHTGPPFRELDDELQESLYEFLEERGIDESLCNSLHNYMSYKENAEYIRWLKSTKSVIEEEA